MVLLLHHQLNKKTNTTRNRQTLKTKVFNNKKQTHKTHNTMKHLLSRPKNIEQFKQNMLLKSATTLLVFSISIFAGTYS